MTIIGSASVQIRALDNLFQKDVEAAVKKIKDVTVQVVAEFEDTEVQRKLDTLRRRVESEAVHLEADVDVSRVNEDIDHVRRKHNNQEIQLQASAATTDASAQLNYVARNRIARIYPLVDPGSFATAKAALESLSGFNTLRTFKDMLKGLASGFDTASMKAITMSSAVMSVVSSIGWLSSEAFAAGEGVAQLVGFFALAPTIIGSFAIAMAANHLAWNNFGAALSDNATKSAKALALLPQNAREAATEVKKLWTEIKKPVQGAFWEAMGTSLQDTVRAMGPALSKGLSDTASGLGRLTSTALGSFKKIAENETLGKMFDNLNLGLDALSRGVGPLFDAFNNLGFAGSKYLPQLGNWLSDLSVRFDNFITTAAANGDIERWIENAKTSMTEIWKIGDATIGIFQGLTSAFNDAGAKGLDGLATSLKGVEDVIKGPVFQSQFSQIFSGMLLGAHATKEGVAELGRSLGDSSVAIGAMFTLAGGVVKDLLDGLGALIGLSDFQVGVVKAFGAMKTALDDLQPAFRNIGDFLGSLLEISAQIFESIVPIINDSTKLIAGIFDNVKGGITGVIPVLMHFVDIMIAAVSGPLLGFSKILGDILTAFTNLPGGVQVALLAMGAALILLPKLAKVFDGFQKGMKDAAKGSDDAKAGFMWLQDAKAWASKASSDIGGAFKDLRDGFTDSKNWGRNAASDLKAAGAMAAADFGRGVKGAFGAAGFVGAEIGQAISKTFSQATGAVQSAISAVAPKLKEFASGLAAGIKGAFGSLDTVSEGFRGIASTISGMVDTAKYNLEGIGATAGVMAGIAKYHVTNAFSEMKNSAANFANLAKAYMGDFASQGKSGFQNLVGDARNFADLSKAFIKDAFTSAVQSTNPLRTSLGHLWDDFYAATIPMEKRVRDAMTGIANAGKTVGDGFKAIGEQFAPYFEPVTRTVQDAATAVRQTTSGMASEVASKVQTIAANIGTFSSSALQGLSNAATGVRDTAVAAAQNISSNFAPVGAAFSAIRASIAEGADHIRTHMSNIGDAFGGAARSTQPLMTSIGGLVGAMGSSAAGGLRLAAGGLVDALGGPWGIALMGATTAIAMFGDAQAKAQAKVDNLAGALDEQSGAFTDSAKKMQAGDLLDQGATWWDDLFRSGRRNMQELVKATGANTKEINDKLSDPSGREAFVANWKRIEDQVTYGKDVTDDLAKSVGMTKEQFDGLSATDLHEMTKQISDAAQTAFKAEEKVRALADATGKNTVQAAILAANYETLGSKTSSASDKFNALKSNLDVLSNKQMSAANASKDYYTQLDATSAKIKQLQTDNEGLLPTMFDIKEGFKMQIPAARELHTALESQADGILKLGTSVMDNALKNGQSLEEAQAKGIASMEAPIAAFRRSLEGMGFVPAQVDAIVASFGLLKDQYVTAIKVGGVDKATMDIARVQLAGQAFAKGDYQAMLAVLPDEAKAAIASTYGVAEAFAKGDYGAVLKAIDASGDGVAKTLGSIAVYTGGDWNAYLKAINGTGPGVNSAGLSLASVTQKDYYALVQAAYSHAGDPQVLAALAALQQTRVVGFTAAFIGGVPAFPGERVNTGEVGIGANGAYLKDMSNIFAGKFPLAKAFAGGGIENHVAQISRGQTPFRIWSEPETGGEAYIPLSISKRKRSKEILELVARQFGFGLVQMFSDGGFSDSFSRHATGSVDSSVTSSGAMQSSAPIVNIHPSAALDEEKVGTIAARELWFQIQNR